MDKNNYIALALLIAVILGGIFLLRDEATPPAEPAPQAAAPGAMPQTITYSTNGFSPAGITIPIGTTVIFKNDSPKNMWVASDPHPTHTASPEFDNRRGIVPGRAYEFTFEKRGPFRYHNHLEPTHSGIIRVE